MNWGAEDLTAASVLMLAAIVAIVVVFRTIHSRVWRLLSLAVIMLVFLTVWAELDVGIF
jgi:hypothetical protein